MSKLEIPIPYGHIRLGYLEPLPSEPFVGYKRGGSPVPGHGRILVWQELGDCAHRPGVYDGGLIGGQWLYVADLHSDAEFDPWNWNDVDLARKIVDTAVHSRTNSSNLHPVLG